MCSIEEYLVTSENPALDVPRSAESCVYEAARIEYIARSNWNVAQQRRGV